MVTLPDLSRVGQIALTLLSWPAHDLPWPLNVRNDQFQRI